MNIKNIISILNPQYKKGILYNYNTNIILSAGIYVNNILNGIGRKYYSKHNNIIQSKGLYWNGMLNGEGITYYSNNNTEYSGTFYKGYRHGIGQLYDTDGILIFSGKFDYNETVN